MAEPIVINAETREITVPESERSFGVAGEHNVARKHFRINGRIVDGNDLAVGFAWKVCTENSAKQPNEYPIDSIIADSDGIEFDWLVGKGALTYKGSLKFAVCAKQVNGEGKVQHEWHSRIGTGTVYDGIEAGAEDIGGFDLRAYIQQTAAEVRQAVQNAAASAKNAETQASDANKAAKSAADNATAAKKSADDAAAAAKTAGDAATKVIKEGVAREIDGDAKHPEGRLDQSPDSRNGGKKCGHRQNCGAKRAEGCREERGQRSQQRIGSQDLCGAGCRRPRHGAGAGGPCNRG